MKPILVEAVRGGTVESRHRVHAVAVANGEIVAQAGDPALVTYLRSAAKPIQALPLVRARSDLDETEIAIASASHLARPEQLHAVRSLLAKASAAEDDLECGPEPTRIEHNCSGKHAGMLALCRSRGWPTSGYRLAGHPCQRALLGGVAAAVQVDADSIPTAVDGCGVITFALTLERMAHAFSRLAELDGGGEVGRAMRAHPALVRGPGWPETELMRKRTGWVAKGGAEGVLCAASPEGLGLALKVEDGRDRAVGPAVARMLERLELDPGKPDVAPLENSSGEVVGELRAR